MAHLQTSAVAALGAQAVVSIPVALALAFAVVQAAVVAGAEA